MLTHRTTRQPSTESANRSKLEVLMQSYRKPHFDYHLANPSSTRFGFIEMDGEMIHKIGNIDDFYHEFGFTPAMNKTGVLPEEFVWTEFIRDVTFNYVPCIQIRIIKYLVKHSEKYREQCESLLADYVKGTVARSVSCAACRMKPVCENLKKNS